MKEIIESVSAKVRPKEGFACSNCPFACWNAGNVAYDTRATDDLSKHQNLLNVEFLDCYCHKKHLFTFDSTIKAITTFGDRKELVVYKHIVKCTDQQLAINEFLSKE